MLRERSGKRSVCYQGTGSEWYRKVACADGTLWIRMRRIKNNKNKFAWENPPALLWPILGFTITGLRVESETKILRRKFICLLVLGHKRLFWFSCITLTVCRHLHATWAENRKWIRVVDSWLQPFFLLIFVFLLHELWLFRIGRDNLLFIYHALTLTGR